MHGLIKKRGRSKGTKDRDPFSKDAIRQRRKRELDLYTCEFEQKMRDFYAYLSVKHPPPKDLERPDFEALLPELLREIRHNKMREAALERWNRKHRVQNARALLDPDLVKDLFSDDGEGCE
jgi:hypothetical protein